MNDPFYLVSSRSLWSRALITIAILGFIAMTWLAVRWQLGNMLAELTELGQPGAAEAARTASLLAPADPLAAWIAASVQRHAGANDGIERTIQMFESVVRLSPNDYRWWIELARAYEQAERFEQAEQAFRRAVELAPSYTYPRWQIGNFYLRQDRSDEGFAELRETTSKSIPYREQVFSLAWDYFENDPQKLEAVAAANSPDVKATLTSFYALRGRPHDALRVWNTLSDEEKARHSTIARYVAKSLYDRRHYREALEFARETAIDPESQPETITNGSFEKFIGGADDTLFGWKIGRGESRMDVTSDSTVKTDGGRSLKVTFRGYLKPQLYNIVQIVVVQPRERYRISLKLRTENLKSGGPPFLRVTSGPGNHVIAASNPFPTGTNDWQPLTLEFTVPENADGIVIDTSRIFCGEPCPITGTFWYDDFRLTRA